MKYARKHNLFLFLVFYIYVLFLGLPEINNALHKRVVRQELDLRTAVTALNLMLDFEIELREEPGMPAKALELASRLRMSSAYDCYYLALAEMIACPFWTGDRKFYQAVSAAFPQVNWIGHWAHGA